MKTPDFLHICVNWHTRDAMMRLYWSFMQHYPDAVHQKHTRSILIPGIMCHVFIPADFDFIRLQGIELKGFDIEYGSQICKADVQFLHSRVRG